jgi:hypothetical protein
MDKLGEFVSVEQMVKELLSVQPIHKDKELVSMVNTVLKNEIEWLKNNSLTTKDLKDVEKEITEEAKKLFKIEEE